jgi:succinate dehydrogenase/fumarate reductase flavoprotein subunit
MLEVAETVVTSALARTESRGHHRRSDYSETDPAWLRHTAVVRGAAGPQNYTVPIVRLGR